MPRPTKRAQQLKRIAPLAIEDTKRRKLTKQVENERAYRIRQRQEDDFWNEYESDLVRDSSSDESSNKSSDESSSEEFSSDERRKGNSDERKGTEAQEGTHEREGKEVQEGTHKLILPVFKSGDGDYLRAVRGTGSLSTTKRERRRIREREKTSSESLPIMTMFARQQARGSEENTSEALPLVHENKSDRVKLENAAKDMSLVLRLKKEQIKRYGTPLIPQSNLYLRHQMVQSFLWMQLKNNTLVHRRRLGVLVAQRFNKGSYTGRRIIQWEKEWISTGKISETKAGKNKHTLSWMDDEDLILAVKTWAKGEGNGKFFNITAELFN